MPNSLQGSIWSCSTSRCNYWLIGSGEKRATDGPNASLRASENKSLLTTRPLMFLYFCGMFF